MICRVVRGRADEQESCPRLGIVDVSQDVSVMRGQRVSLKFSGQIFRLRLIQRDEPRFCGVGFVMRGPRMLDTRLCRHDLGDSAGGGGCGGAECASTAHQKSDSNHTADERLAQSGSGWRGRGWRCTGRRCKRDPLVRLLGPWRARTELAAGRRRVGTDDSHGRDCRVLCGKLVDHVILHMTRPVWLQSLYHEREWHEVAVL